MVLSYADLNHIAQMVTTAYNPNPLAAIDIEDLLQRQFGVSVQYHILTQNGSALGVCANHATYITVWDHSWPTLMEMETDTVFVEKRLQTPRLRGVRNFTIAHEGAHKILFDMDNAQTRKVNYRYRNRNPKDKWAEWQADTLGSCLLMPERNVRAIFYVFFGIERIADLNVGVRETGNAFTAMADYMGVSRQALSLRLTKLSLVDRIINENPLNIYVED